MLNGFTQMNVILCLVVADTRLTPKAHTKISCFFLFFYSEFTPQNKCLIYGILLV